MSAQRLARPGGGTAAVRLFADTAGAGGAVAGGGRLAVQPAQKMAGILLEGAHPFGAQSSVIGRAVEDPHRFVEMRTAFGGGRIVDWLAGEQLPRIC